MGSIKNIFYARYMDDWLVLTNSKTALRKVVKITHQVMHALKFKLHPTKTYIGKIAHGFNFLAYYMDDTTLLPSKETLRRFHERMGALYEQSATEKPRRRHKNAERDISEYHVNEAPPTEEEFKNTLDRNMTRAKTKRPHMMAKLHLYIRRWTRWLMLGLGVCQDVLINRVFMSLPTLYVYGNMHKYKNSSCA